MAQQALYQKLLESRVFPSQAEGISWGKQKKEQYAAADMTVKVDTEAADATRRRWITKVYAKV